MYLGGAPPHPSVVWTRDVHPLRPIREDAGGCDQLCCVEQVVAGALVQQERVLLGHRSAGRFSYPSVWDLPGGHVEFGESPCDALVRELAEELGIRISRPDAPPLAWLHPPVEHEATYELAIWVVTEWTGHVTNCAPQEHDELRWFGADEWPALSLAHPDYSTVLAMAIAAAALHLSL
jgi:8-oxo-dGTP diphosphatase